MTGDKVCRICGVHCSEETHAWVSAGPCEDATTGKEITVEFCMKCFTAGRDLWAGHDIYLNVDSDGNESITVGKVLVQ